MAANRFNSQAAKCHIIEKLKFSEKTEFSFNLKRKVKKKRAVQQVPKTKLKLKKFEIPKWRKQIKASTTVNHHRQRNI